MIYLKINPHATLMAGTPVHLSDVAWVLGDANLALAELTIPLPRDTGIWLVDAGAILSVLRKHCPQERVTLLGDSIGWLKRTPGRALGARLAEMIRAFGSEIFGLLWRGDVPRARTAAALIEPKFVLRSEDQK
jgi:hypothetical protein